MLKMKFSLEILLPLLFLSFVYFLDGSVAEESPTRESYFPERRKSWNSYEKSFQGYCQMLRHCSLHYIVVVAYLVYISPGVSNSN